MVTKGSYIEVIVSLKNSFGNTCESPRSAHVSTERARLFQKEVIAAEGQRPSNARFLIWKVSRSSARAPRPALAGRPGPDLARR